MSRVDSIKVPTLSTEDWETAPRLLSDKNGMKHIWKPEDKSMNYIFVGTNMETI